MANDRLRAAMAAAHMDIEAVARAVGVDPKTVQRWLAGRIPHARHRWALVDLLNEQEELLWPSKGRAMGTTSTAEIVAAYAHRAEAPVSLWSRLLYRTRHQIDLLGYAMLFLPEQHPGLPGIINKRCAATGLKIRIALVDPDCEETRQRDDLERLGGTRTARIRTTLLLVTPYLFARHGYEHPLLHLRRLGADGLFASFADQFETLWAASTPAART